MDLKELMQRCSRNTDCALADNPNNVTDAESDLAQQILDVLNEENVLEFTNGWLKPSESIGVIEIGLLTVYQLAIFTDLLKDSAVNSVVQGRILLLLDSAMPVIRLRSVAALTFIVSLSLLIDRSAIGAAITKKFAEEGNAEVREAMIDLILMLQPRKLRY